MIFMKNKKKFVHFIFFLVLIPCFTLYADPVVVSGGPENDYESWVIRLNDKRLMIIFDRNPDWASGNLYVTFSTDDGNSWDSVVPIIEDPGDQATLSFVQLSGDTIRLWYASNETGTSMIYSAYSLDGLIWTKEGPINLGWTVQDHYDPTVILEHDTSLTMSYRGSGGGYIAHCPRDGTWDTLRTLVAPSGYRPRIMKHTDGTYLYAYHRRTGNQYEYDVFTRTSLNRIQWSDSVRLTYNLNSHDPFPNQTPDGAYLVYYAKYESPAYDLYCRRSYNAIDWEDEEQITFDLVNNTQPHFFCESDEVYLAWAHAVNFPLDHDVYFERFPYSGIEETKKSSRASRPLVAEICPNPCGQIVEIIFDVKTTIDLEISVYDVQGRVVKEPIQKTINGKSSLLLNTSPLANGTYFVRVNHQQGILLKKFIVTH